MLEKILGALLPAVITILLGYFAARHHDFEQKEVPTLNRMVMSYALPLSLFVGVVGADRTELFKDLPMVVILSAAIVGMYWAVFLLARLGFGYSAGMSALGALTASAPSSAFIGATVLGYLYGAKADITVAIASIVIVVALVPVTIVILSLEQSEHLAYRRHRVETAEAARSRTELGAKLLDAAKQSVIWLPLLGFALMLADVPVPQLAANSLALLGHASAGVALFAVGIILAGYRIVVSGPVVFLVLAKNVVQPALVLATMLWLGFGEPILGEAVLTAALPPIALVVMLGVQYRVAARETASALFISTVGSLLTMSAFIAFLT